MATSKIEKIVKTATKEYHKHNPFLTKEDHKVAIEIAITKAINDELLTITRKFGKCTYGMLKEIILDDALDALSILNKADPSMGLPDRSRYPSK